MTAIKQRICSNNNSSHHLSSRRALEWAPSHVTHETTTTEKRLSQFCCSTLRLTRSTAVLVYWCTNVYFLSYSLTINKNNNNNVADQYSWFLLSYTQSNATVSLSVSSTSSSNERRLLKKRRRIERSSVGCSPGASSSTTISETTVH